MAQSDDERRNAAIDKIKKLSAVTASDSGAFETEMKLAGQRIKSLMEQYSITWGEVLASDGEVEFKRHVTTNQQKRREQWHWDLGRLIAKITRTKHYQEGILVRIKKVKNGGEEYVHSSKAAFFGEVGASLMATELFDTWVDIISKMARKATSEYCEELALKYFGESGRPGRAFHIRNLGERHPNIYRNSWIDGLLYAVRRSLPTEVETVKDTALAIYDKALEDEYKKLSEGFSTISTAGSRGHNPKAFKAGLEVGQTIEIKPQSKIEVKKPGLNKPVLLIEG